MGDPSQSGEQDKKQISLQQAKVEEEILQLMSKLEALLGVWIKNRENMELVTKNPIKAFLKICADHNMAIPENFDHRHQASLKIDTEHNRNIRRILFKCILQAFDPKLKKGNKRKKTS